MSEDWTAEDLFALLDDEYARAILTATRTKPMSAKQLSEDCDASLPTIYRRVDRLIDVGLLDEQTKPAADGHHYSVYTAALDRLTVELTADGLRVDVTHRPPSDVADRFTEMWEGI
ncbi:MAG: helix-turn-helix domain-containing protein [Halobacteriota archaeon]